MSKGKMTKAEKITATLSGIAILISILSPIAGYYWLDANLKPFKNRARLQVSSKSLVFDLPKKDDPQGYRAFVNLVLKITNVGEFPAKDIQMVMQYRDTVPSDNFLSVDPPSQYDIRNQDL